MADVVRTGLQFGVAWHPFAAYPNLAVMIGPWPVIDGGFAVADRQWHRAVHDRWAHTVVIDARGYVEPEPAAPSAPASAPL